MKIAIFFQNVSNFTVNILLPSFCPPCEPAKGTTFFPWNILALARIFFAFAIRRIFATYIRPVVSTRCSTLRRQQCIETFRKLQKALMSWSLFSLMQDMSSISPFNGTAEKTVICSVFCSAQSFCWPFCLPPLFLCGTCNILYECLPRPTFF